MQAGKGLEKGTWTPFSCQQEKDIELEGLLVWHHLPVLMFCILKNYQGTQWDWKSGANNAVLHKLPPHPIGFKQFYSSNTESLKQERKRHS